MKEYNLNELNELRIHELRDFARDMGVQSPTSKKKEQLIEEITLIKNGKTEPYISKTKQGRPLKSKNLGSNFAVSEMLSKNENDIIHETDYFTNNFESAFDFSVNASIASYNIFEQEEKVCGVLELYRSGFGVLRTSGYLQTDEDVLVAPIVIKQNDLKEGMVVSGVCGFAPDNKAKMLTKVLSKTPYVQNGLDFDQLPYSALEIVDLEKANVNTKCNLYKGGRNFVYLNNIDFEQVYEFAKKMSSLGHVLFANYSGMPEQLKTQNTQNFEYENILFHLDDLQAVNAVNLMLKSAKRKVESGRDVYFIVNNFSVLLNAVNMINKKAFDASLLRETVQYAKNLIAIAKNVENGASLTIILLDDVNLDEATKTFYKNDFFKLFNTVVQLNKDESIVKIK